MTTQVQEILNAFDLLPESDKRALAGEILRRSLTFDAPVLSEEELTCAAEELFLQLDKDETDDAA